MTAHWAIVPAAGIGERSGTDIPKQYIRINQTYVVEHSINALLQCELIEKIIVVIHQKDIHWESTSIASHPKVTTCQGGKYRFESVSNALEMLSNRASIDDWVVVHDAVRPCLLTQDLIKMLQEIKDELVGGIAVMPMNDTIKSINGRYVKETVPREQLVRAVTPQVFRYGVLREAMEYAKSNNTFPTDEAMAVEQIGKSVKIVECDDTNIKLTYPSDKIIIENILSSRK